MRALTLWQPWASAIVIGAKRYETRSWATRYRGPLAIHAAKRCSGDLAQYFYEDYRAPFKAAGITVFEQLPFGCVLLICQLRDCIPTETIRGSLTAVERKFGNYDDGRFAWLLADVSVLPAPVPARGAQGLWSWNEATQRESFIEGEEFKLVGGETR